jgi:tetratricopeptide (TPR) repeat protein
VRWGRAAAGTLAAIALLASACAKRVAPPVPEGEDYVFPAAGPGEVTAAESKALREAWRDVLGGDPVSAVRRYETLLKRHPGLAPAEVGRAYASLRAGRVDEAAAGFAAVLERRPGDVAALVGAGSAAVRRGDLDGALGFYRRAQGEAPEDALVRKRVAALKLQVTERRMGLAQEALDRGDPEAAAREYAAALEAAPEVAGVRLALAELLVARGDLAGAAAVLEGDPSGDRPAALRRADLLARQQDFAGALEAYRALLARDPSDEAARQGETSAREALEMLSMPEEYRKIADAPRVTRAELAALLSVRVRALGRVAPGEPRVAVDIGGSWAREHVARVLALGIMDPYPNHTFQPGAVVRRVELARAASRALDRLGVARAGAPAPSDMSPSHLDYDAVERVLGAGLMGLGASSAFEPWRPVSGREAIEVVDGVERLASP